MVQTFHFIGRENRQVCLYAYMAVTDMSFLKKGSQITKRGNKNTTFKLMSFFHKKM